MTLDISYTIDCPHYDDLFQACIRTVSSVTSSPFRETELSLAIVSPSEIQVLNAQYRGKDSVTDVLSFHQWNTLTEIVPGYLLGEIIICYQKAHQQAIDLHHSLEEELATLLVHGAFHLQGYDHIEDEESIQMQQKESEVMIRLKEQNLF